MTHGPAENFATSLEGHFVTHQVGWIDYVIIAVSTITVLLSVYYTFKYLLARSRNNHPKIMQEVLDGAREDAL